MPIYKGLYMLVAFTFDDKRADICMTRNRINLGLRTYQVAMLF